MEQKENTGVWSESRVQDLVRLWSEGLSAAKISARLGSGFTRSAVAGKLFRLGLSRGEEQRQAAQSRGARTGRTGDKARAARQRAGPPMEPAPPIPERPCPVVPRLTELVAMPRKGCRWPYSTDDGVRFCAHPARDGSAYCGPHHQRAYFAVLPPLTLEMLAARPKEAPCRFKA